MMGNAGAILMPEKPVFIETSFADAIAIIAEAEELPAQKRQHWVTSLRQIAKGLDKPLEVIPARYSAVRANFAQLHYAPAGLTAKTLQNHKSNTKSARQRFVVRLQLSRLVARPRPKSTKRNSVSTTPWPQPRLRWLRESLRAVV